MHANYQTLLQWHIKRIIHANLFMHTTRLQTSVCSHHSQCPWNTIFTLPHSLLRDFYNYILFEMLVKSCIYFAYWLIQATHYLPVDLHNFALKLIQMPKFRCIQTQITQVPKFRQMYACIREYTPPIDKLWALEMWTDFRAVSCSFQE